METIIDDFLDEFKDWLGYGRKPIKRIKTMEINDLAIGKWYETVPNGYMKPLVLKHNCLTADSIYHGRFIEKSNVENNDWWKTAVLLTDLEEIQQFLPENHVDNKKSKEVELVVGQWIEFNSYQSNGSKNIIKIKQIHENGDISGNPWLHQTYMNGSGTWTKANMFNIKSASMKEVYEYFPEERPKEQSIEFPKDGKCTTLDQRLLKYLVARPYTKVVGNEKRESAIGVAWNSGSHWFYLGSSEKPEYTLAQLEPFLKDIPMDKPKELTSLPEKWCIRALNNEQFSIIKPYFQKLKSHYKDYIVSSPNNGWSNREIDNYTINIDVFLRDGYIELTLDQFRKWVLKEEIKQEIPMKEEYWIIISNGEGMHSDDKGKLVIKLENKPSGNISHNYYPSGYYFKFLDDVEYSTREGSDLYGNCGVRMIRKATPEEIEKLLYIKKEENLVGRYLKALKDRPQSIRTMKKGDFLLITIWYPSNTGTGEFQGKKWSWDLPYEDTWELMPQGFIPPINLEKQEQGFIIGDIITDEEVFFEYKGLGTLSSLSTSGFRISTSVWTRENQFSFKKEKLRKCTEEETRWYNKCKEASKFIPKEEALKSEKIVETYNVGDWVVISKWPGIWTPLAGGEYPADAKYPLTVQIKKIQDGKDYKAMFDGKYGHCLTDLIKQNAIRKASLNEIPVQNTPIMSKFKIGDEVELVHSNYFTDYDGIPRDKIRHGSQPRVGDKGKIVEFYDKYYIVDLPNSKLGYEESSLKLVNTSSVIPEYVECLSWAGYSHKAGKIYKVTNEFIDCEKEGSPTKWENSNNWRVSTYSAYMAQQEILNKGSILEEARKKYPIGTKFICVHLRQEKIVNEYIDNYLSFGCIRSNGGGSCLYDKNIGWAIIVETPAFNQKELLLQEAKLKYPPGTKFESPSGDIFTVSDKKDPYINDFAPNIIWNGDGLGRIYNEGKWSRILESPKYVAGIDPYEGAKVFPYRMEESHPINVELLSPRKEAKIDTSVNKVSSVKTELLKRSKVVYF